MRFCDIDRGLDRGLAVAWTRQGSVQDKTYPQVTSQKQLITPQIGNSAEPSRPLATSETRCLRRFVLQCCPSKRKNPQTARHCLRLTSDQQIQQASPQHPPALDASSLKAGHGWPLACSLRCSLRSGLQITRSGSGISQRISEIKALRIQRLADANPLRPTLRRNLTRDVAET